MIDFHCHLDLFPDPIRVAERCEAEGIYVLSVTTTPSAWHGTKKLERSRIRTALGLHPQLAHQRKNELALFDSLIAEARYVGEIGLDGAPEYKQYWEDQLFVFRHILAACGATGGRIMSIHSRRASRAVLNELQAHPRAGIPVLHWFSGSERDLGRAVEIGCWFSLGPAMLQSSKGRTLAARMPRERILTESDGPFAQISKRTLLPWDTDIAEFELAAIWNMTHEETTAHLHANLKKLVGGGACGLFGSGSREEDHP